MNDPLDHDDPSLSRGDRELTLGTGTILGIFFGLVVLCGACFGGGYLMGHKAQPSPLTLADASPMPLPAIARLNLRPARLWIRRIRLIPHPPLPSRPPHPHPSRPR